MIYVCLILIVSVGLILFVICAIIGACSLIEPKRPVPVLTVQDQDEELFSVSTIIDINSSPIEKLAIPVIEEQGS